MVAFYKALGFTTIRRSIETGLTMAIYVDIECKVSICKMFNDLGFGIELLVYEMPGNSPDVKINSNCITHVAFAASNLDGLRKVIQKKGGSFLTGLKYRRDDKSPWVMFCKDPCGNILELVQCD